MSSIMRARSAVTGRGEEGEVIGGSSLELKVAGPSMLGIGCPDRHALPLTALHCRRKCIDRDVRHPARAGSFKGRKSPFGTACRKWLSRAIILRDGGSRVGA